MIRNAVSQSCRRATAGIGLALALALSLSGCFLIPNLPPTAIVQATVTQGTAPLEIQFDATASSDADGVVAEFHWSFGDGDTASAMRPTHVYSLPGQYDVVLTVTDDDGAAATAQFAVEVVRPNALPSVTISLTPSFPSLGETVSFDASGSIDSDGQIVSYAWDFGDGSTGNGVLAEHLYDQGGTYDVTVTVTDDLGGAATAHVPVQIDDANQVPQAKVIVSTTSIDPGDVLQCSAEGSSDPDGTIVSIDWDFGDGGSAQGATATHAYAHAGTYAVTATVTDNQGARQSAVVWVYVGGEDVDPSPQPVDPGEVVSLSFRWTFGGRSRSLSIGVPTALYEAFQAAPHGVWGAEGYAPFLADTRDDALMIELRDKLLIDNSYQATIENALAFVQHGIAYEPDSAGTEYPRYPVETLVDGMGDCEDSAMLYAGIVRAFGYTAGALLISVDTDGDRAADHIAVLVRVADCFIRAHPDRSLWTISGRTYAFAETAMSSGYLALGIDPWGLEQEDILNIWDATASGTRWTATKGVGSASP